MEEFKLETVFVKMWTARHGNPKACAHYFTNRGELYWGPNNIWTATNFACDNVEWWLRPKSGVFIGRAELLTSDLDYIAVPTKITQHEQI